MELERKIHVYRKCHVICFPKHSKNLLLCLTKETVGPQRAPLMGHHPSPGPTLANSGRSSPLQAPRKEGEEEGGCLPSARSTTDHTWLTVRRTPDNWAP